MASLPFIISGAQRATWCGHRKVVALYKVRVDISNQCHSCFVGDIFKEAFGCTVLNCRKTNNYDMDVCFPSGFTSPRKCSVCKRYAGAEPIEESFPEQSNLLPLCD